MQIQGTIKVVKPTQQITATFCKREFVIETDEKYKQTIQLELHGDSVDIIDNYTEGQEIICDLNLRGRSWTNPEGEEKFFNTIVCWKIQPSQQHQTQGPPPAPADEYAPPIGNPNTVDGEEEHDDLPF
jgi:hypothetical protein